MAQHEIRFSKESVKTLESLEAKQALRIFEAIKKLATTPRSIGCRKMVGSEKDYRIRVGELPSDLSN